MSLYKELSYDRDFEHVKGIQFCVMGPDEIRKRSVAEVTKNDAFNGNEPAYNGLFDPRMGVIDHNKVCVTCNQKNTFCPGHFGHIELAKPVFHVHFYDTVKKCLKCVCFRCSKLLIDHDSPEIKALEGKKISRQKRWDHVYKQCLKVKRCGQFTTDGCGAKQPTITKDGMLKIGFEWRDVVGDESIRKQTLGAEEVLQILRRISDRDAETMGFHPKYNRPEWMICTVLPVPPPAVRPSVRTETGQRQEDDLTHKLLQVVKHNRQLQQKIARATGPASNDQIDALTQLLQYEVATMIDNTNPSIPTAEQKTGRPIRSLTERLKSKDGRIRGNLMGKRVDFSARSVITPDPNISIDELGVPLKIAMNMTFPEIVTKYNKDDMYKLVRNGPDTYPGAKHVKSRRTGVTKRLKNVDRNSIILEEGDVIERHMRNGDWVLFNRQPSLHRMSMLAHRVRVMPFNTFRLNVQVTPCYNADFDGDEMNLHFPQSHQTMEELRQLCAVPTQIISPRDCSPIISIVQDVCLGVYRLTKNHVRIPERQFFNLLTTNEKFTGIIPKHVGANDKAKVYTGQQTLSMIMPPRLNTELNTSAYVEKNSREWNIENGNVVSIKNGNINSGTFDKGAYQQSTKGIVHATFNEFGPNEARLLYDHTQKLVCDFLVYDGFSVGISDLALDAKAKEGFRESIRQMKIKTYNVITQVHEGRLENNSTYNNHDMFEHEVNRELNAAVRMMNAAVTEVSESGSANTMDHNNRLLNMIKSKSKGNPTNVSQMIACVGQQNIDGNRIPYGFEDRTLPHYTKYDDGPESRGFVENSFIDGLTPQGFFFHAMGGREGLIDTAVQSVTGDTAIVIIDGGVPKYVKIGDWVDNHLNAAPPSAIKVFPEQHNMEYFKFDEATAPKVYIPTCDSKGVSSWGEVTAVTRHDPGAKLYEIKTLSGRTVNVVDTKSLLIWDSESKEFKEMKTSDVKLGDCVPVTARLPTPPVIVTHVDMTQFFPKTEYIYGTEINTAISLMKEAQGDKFHIPRGWWEKNNGVTFTTPYTNKAKLQRVTVRSNTENLQDGAVYPFHATREHCHMPAKFELNEENGIFIGLYLADGCTHEKSGMVTLASVNPTLQRFYKGWFDKFGITSELRTREVELGTTASTYGRSTLLARFLDAFLGHGARNKYVPDIAFVAPDEFVAGLINGYFSGDGTISKSNISASSISQRLLEGISMLLSRFGIFSKISSYQALTNNLGTKDIARTYELSISGNWRRRFGKCIKLVKPEKQEKLNDLMRRMCDGNKSDFYEQEDVVLDPITEMNELDVTQCPKVYDLTIPTTLNFSISNSIIIRDTSETGYIQRKLVKAMEDCKVNHDLSVRNAAGVIIQFLYGEDGMDACKLERQAIPYIRMEVQKIKAVYDLVDGIKDFKPFMAPEPYKDIEKQKSVISSRMLQHYEAIVADRDHIVSKMFKGITADVQIVYPVSFHRIITGVENMYQDAGVVVASDLSPLYVLDTIDRLCKELVVTKNYPGNYMMNVLLRCFLSPKFVICKHHLTKKGFNSVVDQVKYRFFESLVTPSEMVGVVAAQSLGEPATQLVLNSVAYDTELLINRDGVLDRVKIGEFIDDYIEKGAKRIEDHPHNTKLAYLEEPVTILSCDEDGKIAWQKVEALTRHPVVNKDGSSTVIEVTTQSGRKVIATKGKSFLKRVNNKIVACEGEDLNVGDYLPVSKILPITNSGINTITELDLPNILERLPLDDDFGFFIGTYLANGMTVNVTSMDLQERIQAFTDKYTSQYHMPTLLTDLMYQLCGVGAQDRRVPAFAFQAPDEFVKAMIDGYYSSAGTVSGLDGEITTSSVSRGLLEDLRQVLVRFGIMSQITSADVFTLNTSHMEAVKFARTFTLTTSHEQAELHQLVVHNKHHTEGMHIVPNIITSTYGEIETRYKNVQTMLDRTTDEKDCQVLQNILDEDIMYDKIVSIKEIANPTDWVYDLTIEKTRTFDLFNGLCQFDTFHSSGISSASATVRGVPRLNELLAVSKNIKTPFMQIYLDPSINTDKKKCLEIMNSIRTIRFKDIITSSKIYFDPEDFTTTVPEDQGFMDIYRAFSNSSGDKKFSPWLLRLELNRDKVLEYNLDMVTLHHVLDNFYDETIRCMFSDDNAAKLVMRVRLQVDSSDDVLTDLKALEHNILESLVIKGIKNVERCALEEKKRTKYNPITKSFDQTEPEWTIQTAGTNLRETLTVPIVNSIHTVSNDINEIYDMFGIEAARAALYNEIIDVLGESIHVNYRHIALLVDVMTNRGIILAVSRHGINRGDIGPLAKCSFEETTDKLIKAGIFAEHDKINGVSANVMLGQIAPCGTGDVTIMIDEGVLSEIRHAQSTFILGANGDDEDASRGCTQEELAMVVPAQVNAVDDELAGRKVDNEIVFV